MRLFRVTPIAAALVSAFAFAAPAEPAEPPTTLTADQIDGALNDRVHAQGNAVATRGDQTIEADWLDYYQQKSRFLAGDKVRLSRGGDTVTGRDLDYAMDENRGVLRDASLTRRESRLRADGEQLEMTGENTYRIDRSRFTTCAPGNDDWYIRAREMDLDYNEQVGVAHGSVFEFKGVPLMYSPWMDFPLDGSRKTGLLTPTFGFDSKNGFDYAQPVYINLAPNYDATITPRAMGNRGLQLGGEFRYLQPGYSGKVYAEGLDDHKYGDTRSAVSLKHLQDFGGGLTGFVDYREVSDNAYYRDLGSDRQTLADNVNLLQQASLSWNAGWGSWTLNAQQYQTLQDPLAPITKPYARLPQILFSTGKELPLGLQTGLGAEFVSFSHPTLQRGERLVVNPTVSLPLTASWGYITPKIGLHHTDYSLQGSGNPDQLDGHVSRTLQTFSVDSGLFFDRPTTLFGADMVQTLEPRLFYVNIPYRDQSKLPVFDTTENSFDFAQIFTENRFSGSDRINDANQLTAALTSRYIDAKGGFERLRVSVGQRFSFRDQLVTLPGGAPLTDSVSDFLAAVSGQLNRRTTLESNYQYNNTLGKTERYNWGVRYSPAEGKILSARFRYDRATLVGTTVEPQRQVDLAAMWPLGPRWYALARENYSLDAKTPLEHLVGLEYHADCWALRFVAQRYVSDLNTTRTGFFLQLELAELGGVGVNPINTLRLAIPGYSPINRNVR